MVVQSVFYSLLGIFLMLIPGIVFRKREVITEEQSKGINSFVVNLTWPCLVIDAMQMDFSKQILKDSGKIFLICMSLFVLLFLFSFPFAKTMKLSKKRQYLVVFMLLFGNTGFIGIPVMYALYGNRAVFFMAIIEFINDILIFSVGIWLIQISAGYHWKIEWKKFFSPGMVGVVFGFSLFVCRITLPQMLGETIKIIGNTTTPLTMFMIGFQLGGMQWKEILCDKQIYRISIIKLLLVPALCMVLLRVWTTKFSLLEKVCVMSFAMPVASVSAIFSQKYRSDEKFAAKTILLSTVLSFISIPLFALLLEG